MTNRKYLAAIVALGTALAVAGDAHAIVDTLMASDVTIKREGGYCSWSRPHIVFENNTATAATVSIRFKDGRDLNFGVVNKDSSVKLLFDEAEAIVEVTGNWPGFSLSGSAINFTRDGAWTFYCGKAENFLAYRVIFRKDGKLSIYQRSK